MRGLAMLFALCVIAAGCGKGGSSSSHSLAATKSCLEDANVSVSTSTDDLDYVAQAAGEGAFLAHVGSADATVAFERSANDAKRTKAAYEAFAEGTGVPTDDILFQEGNAVVLWSRTPEGSERETLKACLQERSDSASSSTTTTTATTGRTPAELASLTRKTKAMMISVPAEVYFSFSPEGKQAWGEVADLVKGGLTDEEVDVLAGDLKIIDRELAYAAKHQGEYNPDK